MSQHQQIMAELARQYAFLSDAVIISPTGLAARAFDAFATGEEDPHIQYTSLEHLKHMARVYLAKQKDPDSDENPAHQEAMDFGPAFTGLQDRYPLPRKAGEEPVYKLRHQLTDEEREWNALQLEKSGFARLKHADALRAEGQMRGVA